jgi:hypothetical protein
MQVFRLLQSLCRALQFRQNLNLLRFQQTPQIATRQRLIINNQYLHLFVSSCLPPSHLLPFPRAFHGTQGYLCTTLRNRLYPIATGIQGEKRSECP